MKGADQCPKCGSRSVRMVDFPAAPGGAFYAAEVSICQNCKTLWEPFAEADLQDAGDRYSSFREPCGNCAFRPGSPEQNDTEKWATLIASLKSGGRFYCHKGVPIDPGSKHGFAYPTTPVSTELTPGAVTEDPRKLRLCRGFLRMWGAQMDKETA